MISGDCILDEADAVIGEKEMLEIEGINHEMVKLHGRSFLQLIENVHQRYEEMMQQKEAGPRDPNHQIQNIVEISSESEYGGDDDLDELDAEDDATEQRSHHFNAPAEVSAFNARCEYQGNALAAQIN